MWPRRRPSRGSLRVPKFDDSSDESPLRERLFNTEQMEEHGRRLAQVHRVRGKAKPDRLLARLSDNEEVIDRACAVLTDALASDRRLTPAGDWLLDNIYLIEEQISLARRHLPKGYSRELPQLAAGSSEGLPRVYDIALNDVAHDDGRVDGEILRHYVAAYQTITPLSLGELWAIPIMLRLALIENLRRIAERMIEHRLDRNLAGQWADKFTDVAESDPTNLVLVVADMARSNPPSTTSYIAELSRRLQGQGSALMLPITWIEQRLAGTGQTIQQMVQAESQQQAADQVSVSNSIGSLRLLAMMDWKGFVESISVVEHTLRHDPAAIYASMDFATRDHYRHVTERVARRCGLAEVEVATTVLRLARASTDESDDLAAHVGFYLIGDGRHDLEKAVGRRRVTDLRHTPSRLSVLDFSAPHVAIVGLFAWGMFGHSWPTDAPWWLWIAAVLSLIALSDLAVALVNRLAALVAHPSALPRLDLSEGIPVGMRTLVVVPTMFGSPETITRLVEALEVCFLANRDDRLHFALLTDFFDDAQETAPHDTELLDVAQRAIEALNARYYDDNGDRFFLLHRPRLWNPSERVWMGYERKRGKLAALNAFLRSSDPAAFVRIVGRTAVLSDVRYVITIDADSTLPRDAARQLVGTLAHPLNHARFDERHNVVSGGYGILHPRVGSAMSDQRRSRYANLYGSEPGIDPYTRAVSDVYQDLFGEGSFVGKGIYDVDAFERALAGRIPENRILSHDLLEGCYARAGLVSDVQIYEHYPASYAADVSRRHRWIRGDWQLVPWVLFRVPRSGGQHEHNPLSLLSRGKLLDNLRRSVVPAALTSVLVIGWALRPDVLAWTLWLLSILIIPPTVSSVLSLLRRQPDVPIAVHLRQTKVTTLRNFAPVPVTLACLPFEAYFCLDAIVRTLWRMLISRRHLLQWKPSSEVERTHDDTLAASVATMWFGPVFALGTTAMLAAVQPSALWVASPILLLWAASPFLMWWMGRARIVDRGNVSDVQLQFLGRLARRTWAFFETYVTEADHWLPPDNVQLHPSLVVAHRTSPTNIGLSVLADLAAYDLGYLPLGAMAERTARALKTLESLPRYRGHFLNWYDTTTLQPLSPRYVSVVDSGNLAGHLLTLRQGLLELRDAPVLAPRAFLGLGDTFGLVVESPGGPETETEASFRRLVDGACAEAPKTADDAQRVLAELGALAATIEAARAGDADESHSWAQALTRQCVAIHDDLGLGTDQALIVEFERLAHIAGQLAQMDQAFLYDPDRHLMSIGYNVDEHQRDAGYYDLLASEARLGNFVAIAQGQVPQESWFALGRMLTEVNGNTVLLSWSGSMFEYLMPQLVMPSYEGTLLDQTGRHCVERQIQYGHERGVPWGISESGYNLVDARFNYQYRAFGVPGLALQRRPANDLVIAPYATAMALMVDPVSACLNLLRMTEDGFSGRYGMYEAIDYTASRLSPGKDHAVVRSYMSHHQGMSLLSLDYVLCDQPMQRRFTADPEFRATVLLLQERIPKTGVLHSHADNADDRESSLDRVDDGQFRVFHTPETARPAVQMLSNGRYHVMVTSAGGGYSRLGDMAVTRWREDGTRDHWGNFCFLRDVDSGEFWSTSHQPSTVPVEGYQAIFSDARVEFRGSKRGYETHTEIAVSPEDNVELRRLRLTNRTQYQRTVEIVTYAEVVLASAISDELHPAFSNLFVQTEVVRAKQAIMCNRRPRSSDEVSPWMFHLIAVHDADVDAISYETDRARFIGRGNTLLNPDALTSLDVLSNSDGSVLDPIVAIRCKVTLAPGQTTTIDMVVGAANERAECDALIDKYRDRRLADRVSELAWTHSQVVRHQLNASEADAQVYERLAGLLIFAHPALRAEQATLLQNRRGQSGLWGQAISGDYPIALVRIADAANLELVRQMVQAHAYWRLKGLAVDLVIWNEDQAGYRQQLQDQIIGLVAAGVDANAIDRPGGIFVRPALQLSPEDRVLLLSVARVVVSDAAGTLTEQVGRRPPDVAAEPLLVPQPADPEPVAPSASSDDIAAVDSWPFEPVDESSLFDNGFGGFSSDAREYVIRLDPGQTTPAPWSNVLANADFGCVVTDSTPGYTWGENAHEFRLTPWHNDPVMDSSGEAFYVRDTDTGNVWSPMPFPCRGQGSYRTRHGFGYSVYEHTEDGIASELWIYVGADHCVKYSVLKLRNQSGRARRLSATGYVEWILGDLHARTQMHVTTEIDNASNTLTARNTYNTEFENRVAFFDARSPDVDISDRMLTGDRKEFLGRNGALSHPAAMLRERLSGTTGVGFDPCAAIQVPVMLAAGQRSEVVFRLGVAATRDDAIALALRTAGSTAAHEALAAVRTDWTRTLGTISVDTPDPSVNLLANGWLLYQTIGCRYLARSGYYQSGGAVGFRDQLQDTMAMLHAEPLRARDHLLLCAAHQFPDGDVQHWWHPPIDRGVRTRCSDDFVWLPLAAARYVEITGDSAVLDEQVNYIEGRPLNADEESYYDLPTLSDKRQSLYEHCVASLERALTLLGERGLPLMASGDWNDGMNRVGEHGRGESVWLGFFLFDVLTQFAPVARAHDDDAFASRCVNSAEQLRVNIEAHAWDGAWYRRAWFDDGSPLGSTESDECTIDSIAQSWSVLSGAGDPVRARQALASLDEHLVRRDSGLIQLLHPPFDKTFHDPGYIRGYVPGVRENGGQYTHAAVWAVMAFARVGDRKMAWELFDMINPVSHGRTAEAIAIYKVEPYVIAADVYAVEPHVGRGGWTWYTGSAGWMYRLIVESLLGVRRNGTVLRLDPCIPADWPEYSLNYRFGETTYRIRVIQQTELSYHHMMVDGHEQADMSIALRDDHYEHVVELRLGTEQRRED
jgi:cyclic beta-1,2-glucan synthetase